MVFPFLEPYTHKADPGKLSPAADTLLLRSESFVISVNSGFI
jgi:hypothetical protein